MKKILFVFLLSAWAMVASAQLPPSAKHNFSVSPQGGFYSEKVTVEIDVPEGVKVYYTTNGRIPSTRQKPYTQPLSVEKTMVVRVLAVFPDKKRRYRTNTYFINEPLSTIPVLSLSLPPDILFDPDHGLYVEGPHSTGVKNFGDGSNYWSTREIPTHFEFYEPNGSSAYNGLVGLRIFGGISRTFPQKSFALVARKKYGQKWIKHRVFGQKGLAKYKYLVLRNSGSDWGRSFLRDAFMTTLVEDWNVTKQDYRPSHLYINGKYWGLYNIREKVNRTFVAQHFDVDKNKMDLIEHRKTVKKGSSRKYLQFLNFIKNSDLSQDQVFAQVEALMDVDNFMDLQIAQIYFNNTDAGGNIKFWREQKTGAKWRWILYDTDWGFGLNGRKDYRKNSLKLFTEDNGPKWPLPNWSTFILRKLLTNKQFEHRFVNRFADRLNTTLQPQKVKHLLGEMAATIQPEIGREQTRWHLRESRWKRDLAIMKRFAEKRPGYIAKHLKYKFKLKERVPVVIESGKGGHVVLNENVSISDHFEGQYFANIPVQLSVVAEDGFHFVGWEGFDSQEEKIRLLPGLLPKGLKAKFEPFIHPLSGKLVINEVSANDFKSGDWVELVNYTEESILLKDLQLRDDRHVFDLPEMTLPKYGFVIVCEDTAAFRAEHPEVVAPIVGNLGFGFNKRKEEISVYSMANAVVDKVSYEMDASDDFQSLSLLAPKLDNAQFDNWEILEGRGTPGKMNPYYVLSKIQATQAYYSKLGLMAGAAFILLMILYVKHSGQVPAWTFRLIDRLPAKIKSRLLMLLGKEA